MFNQDDNYFHWFGLAVDPEIDAAVLRKAWHTLQKSFHPDVQKEDCAAYSHRINNAYQTLRDPHRRVAYLLKIHQQSPTHTDQKEIPVDFLSQQMEWQEIIHTPGHRDQHERIAQEIDDRETSLRQKLFDEIRARDWPNARKSFLLWSFLIKNQEKLNELIGLST